MWRVAETALSSFNPLQQWASVRRTSANIPIPKAAIPWLAPLVTLLVVVLKDRTDQFVAHDLLHNNLHEFGTGNSTFLCCLLEILDLQRDHDILHGHVGLSCSLFTDGRIGWELVIIVASHGSLRRQRVTVLDQQMADIFLRREQETTVHWHSRLNAFCEDCTALQASNNASDRAQASKFSPLG
jgi:hypothetical protein